jgi:ATP-dependent Clp protease ATP-binding subunit ClpX
MENVDLTFQDEALGAMIAQGHRAQDRRARPALDHGRHPARHDVRSAGLEGVEQVVIGAEVVEGKARPLYIYAERSGRASGSALFVGARPWRRHGVAFPPSCRATVAQDLSPP